MFKKRYSVIVLVLFLASVCLIWAEAEETEAPEKAEPAKTQTAPAAQETPSKELPKAPPKPQPAHMKDLESLKDQLLAHTSKLSQRLDSQINGIKLDMDRFRRDVRGEFRMLKNLPTESLTLQDDVSGVKRSLREAQGQIRVLQRENERLRQDVDELQRELRHLKSKMD
jgi:chromosome segregation ATPase